MNKTTYNRLKKAVGKLLPLWDFLYIGIIGMNSFIMLLYRKRNDTLLQGHNDAISKVVGAAALGYFLVFFIESLMLMKFKSYSDCSVILYKTHKVFRLMYMAISLAIIMINQIQMGVFESCASIQNPVVVKSVLLFSGTVIMGTCCLWSGPLLQFSKNRFHCLMQMVGHSPKLPDGKTKKCVNYISSICNIVKDNTKRG